MVQWGQKKLQGSSCSPAIFFEVFQMEVLETGKPSWIWHMRLPALGPINVYRADLAQWGPGLKSFSK